MFKLVRRPLVAALLAISAAFAIPASGAPLSSVSGASTKQGAQAKAHHASAKKRKAKRRKRRGNRPGRHAAVRARQPMAPGQASGPAPAMSPNAQPADPPAVADPVAPSDPATPTDTPPPSDPPPSQPVGPNDVVTPMPLGQKLFAPNSFWNAPLPADVPVDPASSRLVDALSSEVDGEIQARTGPWINTDSYSTPVYTVGSDIPKVHVTLDVWAPQLQAEFDQVPIPAGAKVAGGSDRHLTIYQPSTDTLWEMWLASNESDGWHARWGGKMTSVSTNPGYFGNPYGATATSLPLLGGLMTMEELKKGEIDHALALAIPNTKAGATTWPAQREDGKVDGPQAIPEGTRFRIDPSVDLTKLGLTRTGLVIARAAQKYGIVVRDTSGCVTFYGEDPVASWNMYPWLFDWQYPSDVLSEFPWKSLQVVAPQPGG
jgi:hypothetical protein